MRLRSTYKFSSGVDEAAPTDDDTNTGASVHRARRPTAPENGCQFRPPIPNRGSRHLPVLQHLYTSKNKNDPKPLTKQET